MAGKPHNPKRSYPGGYDKPRHEFKPTEAQRARVARMALAGVTRDLIADRIGIARKTLAKHFDEELAAGKAEIDEMCVGKLVEQIKKGNVSAICFYLKTKCGWKETNVLEGSVFIKRVIGVNDDEV